jgi:hypothetical protein
MDQCNLATLFAAAVSCTGTPHSIAEAGERFLVEVYGYNGRTSPSLNHLRFLNYKKAVFLASSKIAALSRWSNTTQL